MTITPTAPSITPCPVDWCPDAGRHEWTHLLGSERSHRRHVLVAPTLFQKTLVVTAEVYETTTESEPLVELDNAEQLYSREQVEQVIAAMREAADLAFGPVPDAFDLERAELATAVAEVAVRADHPQDVNRLVAAAIRLRNAHRVLAEVTR